MKLRVQIFIICVVLPNLCLSQRGKPQRNKRKKGIPCSRFDFEGYLCVHRDNCGNDGYTVDDAVDSSEVRNSIARLRNLFNPDFESAEYQCPSKSSVCCRKSSFYGKPEPIIRDVVEEQQLCSEYANHGYYCIEDFECGDDGYTIDHSIDGDEVGVRSSGSFATSLSCETVSDFVDLRQDAYMTCCRNSSYYGLPEPDGKYIPFDCVIKYNQLIIKSHR